MNYFDLNTTYHVKLQILETLSSVLSFTEEERVKVGLHRERLEKHLSQDDFKFGDLETMDGSPRKNGEGEGLGNKFLNFLIEGAEDKE